MKSHKKKLFNFFSTFLACTPLISCVLYAAQAPHSADIQWLQHMSRQLKSPINRSLPSVMKHIEYGIRKKLSERPELATLPFPRTAHNAHQQSTDMRAPTSEATLFLRALETANFSLTKTIMQAGISPLKRFDLSRTIGLDRVKRSHLGALFDLATSNALPADKYVKMFTQLLEYLRTEKQEWLDDFRTARRALEDLDHIPKDHTSVILDMLGGDKEVRRNMDRIEPERIIGSLKQEDEHENTLLDLLVDRACTNVPFDVHYTDHERARHTLQTYLLHNGVRLNRQKSLHSSRLRTKLALKVASAAFSCLCLGYSLRKWRQYSLHDQNQNACQIAGAALVLCNMICKWQRLPRIAPSVLISIRNQFLISLDLDYLVKHWLSHLTYCTFLRMQPNAEGLRAIFNRAGVVGSIPSNISSAAEATRMAVSVYSNMIGERYTAWKKGITNIWGRKIPESALEAEVGGLE